MLLRCAFLIALVLCLAAPSAFAQGMDDLLAPLTPSTNKKGKGKGKATQRRTPKASKKASKKAPKAKKRGKKGKGSRARPPEPEASEAADLLLAPLVKKTELLVKMNGSVRGARLFLNEKELGPMPRGPIEVDPGEHVVSVRRPGYRDFTRRINAKEGEVTELAVLMEPTSGFISVKVDVEGARVLINGEDKGVAPIDDLMLPAGSYEIVVQREGFRPESQRIAVRAGKEYNVDVNLRPEAIAQSDQPRAPVLTPSAVSEPSPFTQQPVAEVSSRPLTSRWYFWAGVGAVVTAAAVGTVMATQQQPLDPNAVCDGPCDGVINRPTSGGLFQF